jgi:outer membrane receptor protein involved in Fe transport
MGRAVVGARVQGVGAAGVTGDSGCVGVVGEGEVRVSREGFAAATAAAAAGAEVDVVLRPAERSELVEVTATRSPLPVEATASSVRTMSGEQLAEAPGLTLDDSLRQVAGFQLFRRTSSWVANPTTEGTSLRGLGSTAASRTLVLSDQVPLNDAFGGWIHWDEIPELAVGRVELMRGGASDLYGSSAIGGVIDVVPVVPKETGYSLDLAGASRGTSSLNGLVTGAVDGWAGLAAASDFRTDGYILTAPAVRGLVDVPSNVHSQSGRVEMRRELRAADDVFLRGNVLNEARGNGTPLQTNGTRLWRYVGGADWGLPGSGRLVARVYGADQSYRQSFSSIAADRSSEKLTRLQQVPSQQVGAALQGARTWGGVTLVAGGDVLDTRATDNEVPVSGGVQQATQSTSARQRTGGGYGEVLWQPGRWSVAFSSRVDQFRSFDARMVTGAGAPVTLPTTNEVVFDPRLGVVRELGGGFALTASGFRAFRGPTMNELYRTGQVGQQITQANPSLRTERATGWEAGMERSGGRLGTVRASYFWTQVNRPIAAVTLSSTATTVLQMRQNLGQLESRGVTLETELRPLRWMTVTGGYQYADSTVTKFQADPTLVGKWTAQVPRNSASAQVRMERQGWGIMGVDVRGSGQQFDDSANQYRLAGYAQVDLYAEHGFGARVRVYGSVQNVGGEAVEAGKTPLLTLGIPRTVLVGIRLR